MARTLSAPIRTKGVRSSWNDVYPYGRVRHGTVNLQKKASGFFPGFRPKMFPVPSGPPIAELTGGTREILNERPLDGPIVRQIYFPPGAVIERVLGVGYVLARISIGSVVTDVGTQATVARGQQP